MRKTTESSDTLPGCDGSETCPETVYPKDVQASLGVTTDMVVEVL